MEVQENEKYYFCSGEGIWSSLLSLFSTMAELTAFTISFASTGTT